MQVAQCYHQRPSKGKVGGSESGRDKVGEMLKVVCLLKLKTGTPKTQQFLRRSPICAHMQVLQKME